jgi:hypothetical protein
MTLFFRVIEADDKAEALLQAVGDAHAGNRFELNPQIFWAIPGSPFAYQIGDSIREIFTRLPAFEGDGRTAKQGLATADDFRFVRAWWEVPEAKVGNKWFNFAKGGAYSPFYADVHLMVNWESDGSQLYAFDKAFVRNADYYFRPGLTWPRRTTSGLGLRVMPKNCIFADKGPAIFVREDRAEELSYLLGITTSSSFRYFIDLQMGAADAAARSYEVGVVQRTPCPDTNSISRAKLASLARQTWSLKRSIDAVNENSHAFLLPSILRSRIGTFDLAAVESELAEIQCQINDAVCCSYGLEGKDRQLIGEWYIENSRNKSTADGPAATEDDSDDEASDSPTTNWVESLLSWCVGVSFGRFDIHLAMCERQAPPEPDPFDPLPLRSPGMVPAGQRPFRVNTGVYVDDPGHRDDLTAAVQEVLRGIKADEQQTDPETVRRWLARDFFPLHIKMYSKSKRKAPLFWQLATPSASYSVWLYSHSFTRDTLYQVQNDYVATKLIHEERKLEELRKEAGPAQSAADRKRTTAQEAFVVELRVFLDEVRRVAPLWNPALDDGVIINFAPLWRLVPQHKAWQKELKTVWDDLGAGAYDWAHLAMHLWPERVIPKCAKDRSLAIAHGLEDRFWARGDDGKYRPRAVPPKELADMVRERTAPAVKAALESMLTANGTISSASRPRRRS